MSRLLLKFDLETYQNVQSVNYFVFPGVDTLVSLQGIRPAHKRERGTGDQSLGFRSPRKAGVWGGGEDPDTARQMGRRPGLTGAQKSRVRA